MPGAAVPTEMGALRSGARTWRAIDNTEDAVGQMTHMPIDSGIGRHMHTSATRPDGALPPSLLAIIPRRDNIHSVVAREGRGRIMVAASPPTPTSLSACSTEGPNVTNGVVCVCVWGGGLSCCKE